VVAKGKAFSLQLGVPPVFVYKRHRGRGELLDQIFVPKEFFLGGQTNQRRLPEVACHILNSNPDTSHESSFI
jgi:hypothetical protein